MERQANGDGSLSRKSGSRDPDFLGSRLFPQKEEGEGITAMVL
jgi:hypothetical protein